MKILVFLGLFFCLLGCSDKQAVSFENTLIYQPARSIAAFQLKDKETKPFTLQQLKNKWSVLFLGYTSCPDICPTTLYQLKRIYPELKKLTTELQVIFISADPERDTPDKLRQYTEFFHPEFNAVTAEHQYLLPFTQSLGMVYSMVSGEAGGQSDYLINHSASIVIINPEAQIAAMIKPGFEQQIPQIDYAQLVKIMAALVADY